jgi:hypothetical protein
LAAESGRQERVLESEGGFLIACQLKQRLHKETKSFHFRYENNVAKEAGVGHKKK